MNAASATLDLVACERFLTGWQQVTGVDHVTLVSISPLIPNVLARTFGSEGKHGDIDAAKDWIAQQQQAEFGIYFQPNETDRRCAQRPAKDAMVAALCRFADVDPDDDHFPLDDERNRLHRLVEHLLADPVMPPTCVIDSGNGIQPIWVVQREELTPNVIQRVEAQTTAIEHALGAGGTHDVTRLLRLPGTINFPNAVKQKKGRGITEARLLHFSDATITIEQAAGLAAHVGKHVADTGLVRPKAKNSEAGSSTVGDSEVADLVKELVEYGADNITKLEDLPKDLADRLQTVLSQRKRFADRWAGMVDDLSEEGKDASKSGFDFSLAAMAKAAGFSHVEAGLILCANVHSKTNNGEWQTEDLRLRHVARCVLRSHAPSSKNGAGEMDEVQQMMAEFNHKYFVINENGRAIIYQPRQDPILHRRHFDRMSFADMEKLYRNRTVQVGTDKNGNPNRKPVADVWLSHPGRRQYIGGITFDPSGRKVPDDTFNLWSGFAIELRKGSWSRMQDHIHTILCRKNDEHSAYFLDWLARLVQKPAEQGETAIVLWGVEGTGKGMVARAVKRMFGQHALAISNSRHLTGNFNAHLRDAVFLFADEAFFAGDRQHVGVLKSLITEPYLTIEGKFQNAIQTPNFLHLMMASNEEWIVPASLESRRFFVLAASDEKRGNHGYFSDIQRELDNGGHEAMLYDLWERDITFSNLRKVPVTQALVAQRVMSLDTTRAWWLDVLQRGYVYKSKLGLEDFFSEWRDPLTRELLFASYSEFAKQRHERHPLTREHLGAFLRQMGCKAVRPRNAVVGEHIVDVPSMYGTTRKAKTVTSDRAWGYTVGSLQEARNSFLKITGLTVGWDEEGADE